jgi:soluble lytic murein transglycosylase-like protein
MQPIAFCSRCRGMRVGWNRRYVFHCLVCRQWMYKSVKSFLLATTVVGIIFAFPAPVGNSLAADPMDTQPSVMQASLVPVIPLPVAKVSPAVTAIDAMLAKYDVQEEKRARVAKAIVASSRKYNLDSRLVASVMIVESRVDPYAISAAHAIGLMQIHLPTWRGIADRQGIDLFKIEDNIDLGARILKGYIAQYGLWDGVAHYTGSGDSPEIQQAVSDYVHKVQKVYGYSEASDD